MAGVRELPHPYELFVIEEGDVAEFTVVSFEQGMIESRQTWLPGSPTTWKPGVRLHVDPRDKPDFPHYYDVVQARLVPQVLPIVTRGVPVRLRIRARGAPPKKYHSVEPVPL